MQANLVQPAQRKACARNLALATLLAVSLACPAAERSPHPLFEEELLEFRMVESSDESVELLSGLPVHRVVWGMSGDIRPAVLQHPPSRIRVREAIDGARCSFRFGVGLEGGAWGKSDGATFRLAFEREGSEETLLETFFDPREQKTPRWNDFEIALPDGPGYVILETTGGPSGSEDYDRVGWATPHVVCPGLAREKDPLSAPHVILISLDTLRADRLGAYGYAGETSPQIDAFAEESLVFENAFAVAPYTLPTHASMFTGLYPSEHGAGHISPSDALGTAPRTLAEHLRDAGYRTLGVSGGAFLSRQYGLSRGFDGWIEEPGIRLASMMPRIFSELGVDVRKPTFLFLHTYDIHSPYPDAPVGSRAASSGEQRRDEEEWQRVLSIGLHRHLGLERYAGLDDIRRGYDQGIRRADADLAQLFGRLRELEMWDDALVIVTSDHGETLYERGLHVGHGLTLFEELVRIPLILKFPGSRERGRSAELVDQTDLLPTVLAEVGLGVQVATSGSDALARVRGEAPARRLVRGEASHTGARYLRTTRWKVIAEAYPPEDPRSRIPDDLADRFVADTQVFELERDPGELRNVASETTLPAAVRELLEEMEQSERPGSALENVVPSGLENELRALGYIE